MLKKLICSVLVMSVVFLVACSKESKFGLDEFSARMNDEFGNFPSESVFLLGQKDDTNYFFCETENRLISAIPDNSNTIKQISIMTTSETDIQDTIDTYCNMCSVLTGNDIDEQRAMVKNCGITAENIKFADSSCITCVGKYKYVAICNAYSITLFCERI